MLKSWRGEEGGGVGRSRARRRRSASGSSGSSRCSSSSWWSSLSSRISWKTIDTSKDFIEESLRERQIKTAIPAASHIENLIYAHRGRLADLVGTFEVYANDAQYKANFENLLERGILGRNLSDNTLLLSYQDQEGGQFATPWKGVTSTEQAQLNRELIHAREPEGHQPERPGLLGSGLREARGPRREPARHGAGPPPPLQQPGGGGPLGRVPPPGRPGESSRTTGASSTCSSPTTRGTSSSRRTRPGRGSP